MSFIHSGYTLSSTGANCTFVRVDSVQFENLTKESAFSIGFYASPTACFVDRKQPIESSGKYYLRGEEYETIFSNPNGYQEALYSYILTNILGEGWSLFTPE